MIEFHYESDFRLQHETKYIDWLSRVIALDGYKLGELAYIFCVDSYLKNLNEKFLNHDTWTDIITFDYSEGNRIAGDVFISIERVTENAEQFKVDFGEELRRVMVHGVLHLFGHTDKSEEEKARMRELEEKRMKMFHVEQ